MNSPALSADLFVVLSPDSHEDGYEDIVFDDPDAQTVELRGVIKWYQASRVRRY